MAKKKASSKKDKHKRIHRKNISKLWEVKDGKIVRLNRSCPRCGEGVFLARHYNRMSCGKCGYTKFDAPTGKKTASVGGVKRTTRRRRIQR